jgi:hypothetical protein
MLFAYFGGLGADKQTTYELLLELRGRQYTVTAVMTVQPFVASAMAWSAPRRWLHSATGNAVRRRLYTGPHPRLALRTLLSAACAGNLAEHGQRFCYVLPSVPAQPGALANLIPAQLRADGSLPVHPQIWQVGRPLDTLPAERHPQACTDARSAAKLIGGSRSLDDGFFR